MGWIEELGYMVIYGDIDLIFVYVEGNDVLGMFLEIGFELVSIINWKWIELLKSEFDIDCYLEIEFEFYFFMFFMLMIWGFFEGSKKCYVGMKGSEFVFKGLENVCFDWMVLVKIF